jgi:predicted acylesterase/phospholipase RssA
MTIKHLCIPGGGPNGITSLGVLQHLEKNGFWNINNIKTIYATSVGSIISLLIALKFDWDTINDYIVMRPWHETYKLKATNIIDSYNKKGIFDKDVFDMFFKPFFNAKDLNLSMTMKEFYEYSKIELHFFAVEMNHYELVDISHLSFPDIPLIQSIHMSCCIPTLFCPVIIDDKCYIDGGLLSNYPIEKCIENNPKEEILGIHNYYEVCETNIVKNESTIIDFVVLFFINLIRNSNSYNKKNIGLIQNELSLLVKDLDFQFMKDALFSSELRKELLDSGIKEGEIFLSKQKEKSL